MAMTSERQRDPDILRKVRWEKPEDTREDGLAKCSYSQHIIRKPCYFHISNFVFFMQKKSSEKYLRSFIYITIYFNCNMVSICGERSALANGLGNRLKLGNLISRGFPVTAPKELC
jgi:hypothetical protein